MSYSNGAEHLLSSNNNRKQPIPSPYRKERSSFDSDDSDENRHGDRRSVQIIGYLPDLKPFIQPTEEERLLSENARRVHFNDDIMDNTNTGNDDSLLFSPPQTPFLRMFDSKEAFSSWFREGSVRGSVFNLCSATLGAGALALPYAFSRAGWLLGFFMLIVGAIGTIFSIRMLVVARDLTGYTSYEDLTVKLFGRKMGLLVEVNIIVFCFGTGVAYLIAVGDILEPVFENTGLGPWIAGIKPGTPWDEESRRHVRVLAMSIFFAVLMFPLSLLERINSLRFTSFFGVFSICYLVFATVYHSTNTMIQEGFDVTWGEAKLINFNILDFAQAMPIIMFAFTCQVNVFSIYDELERPSPRRMGKVTNWAIFVCIAVYALTGMFGSLLYHKDTNPNILNNFLADQAKHRADNNSDEEGGGQNLILLLSFVAMALTIVMAFPLVVFPCRYTLDVMLYHDAEPSWCRHFVLTAVICGCTLLVSLFVPNISIVFQLMGGTTSAFVCFVLPAAFAIHLEGQQRLQDERGLNTKQTPLYGSMAGNDNNVDIGNNSNNNNNGNDTNNNNNGYKPILTNNNKINVRRISRCEVYGSWMLATMGVLVGLVSTTVTIYNLVTNKN